MSFPPEGQPPGQLYNLHDDPRETKNLAAEKPELVTKLPAELARIHAPNPPRFLATAQKRPSLAATPKGHPGGHEVYEWPGGF